MISLPTSQVTRRLHIYIAVPCWYSQSHPFPPGFPHDPAQYYHFIIPDLYLGRCMRPNYVSLLCSSKDILMRVVAQNLSPELTLVEKVIIFLKVTSVERGLLWDTLSSVFARYSKLIDFILDSSFSHLGNDSKPRLCITRDNNTWCTAYDAWWKVLTSSCGRQRWALLSQCHWQFLNSCLA